MLAYLRAHLRIKLLGLVALPVVGLILLGAWKISDKIAQVGQYDRLHQASRTSTAIGELVLALQAERGTSLMAMGQAASEQAGTLAAKRKDTDLSNQVLLEALQTAPPSVIAAVKPTLTELDHLKDLRQSMDGRELVPVDVLELYTRPIHALLELHNHLLAPAEGTKLEGRLHAFASLLRLSESADLERGMLAHALSSGAFDPGFPDRFVGFQATQAAHAEAYLANLPEAARKEARQVLTLASSGVYREWAAMGLQAARGGKLQGDADTWFQAATARMAAVKRMQDELGRTLMVEAQGLASQAKLEGALLGALCVVFGAAVLLWTWSATGLITGPIQALEDGMARLETGDLRVELPVTTTDETGRMTEAFNAMSTRLRNLVLHLKDNAAKVTGGAGTLSLSAGDVTKTTQALARSASLQRKASEEVAAAITQLRASIEEVRRVLDALTEGTRDAGALARDCGTLGDEVTDMLREMELRVAKVHQAGAYIHGLARRGADALAAHPDTPQPLKELADKGAQAAAMVATLAQTNLQAVQETRDRLAAIGESLAQIRLTMARGVELAEEIRRASHDQALASGEVARRTHASVEGTSAVQQAAAQLANTAPEVFITAKELVGVAQALESSADAFVLV